MGNETDRPNLKSPKKVLRKKLLHQRKALTPQEWQAKSQRICQQLQTNLLFTEAKTVLSYFSFRQEPDLSPLWQTPASKKKWGFPRCVVGHLDWYYWQPNEPLEENKYQIPEPLATAVSVPLETVDLILVPTVACDLQGTRLGYGGGYYDRFLSNSVVQKIPKIGITFDFACVAKLPKESWDIQLDFICSEVAFLEKTK